LSVVIVWFAVAIFPGVVGASRQSDPSDQRGRRQAGFVFAKTDVIDDWVSKFVGNPATG
jgi:hypothetical protein